MNETLLILGGVISVIAVLLLFYPFWAARQDEQRSHNLSAQQLEDELMRVVTAVKDLDFDYDMGKMGDEDYIAQRKYMVGRGVSLVLQLQDARKVKRHLDDEIEKLIKKHKRKTAS